MLLFIYLCILILLLAYSLNSLYTYADVWIADIRDELFYYGFRFLVEEMLMVMKRGMTMRVFDFFNLGILFKKKTNCPEIIFYGV